MKIAVKSFETYGVGRTIRSLSRNVLASPLIKLKFGEKLLDDLHIQTSRVQHELQRF
ncbi:MAG: hypothetical protein ACRCXT_00080 [Paraclostridium sp.]